MKNEDINKNQVNHPVHYQGENGIEVIDSIEAAVGFEGLIAFCLGNAMKYVSRAGKKSKDTEIQDLEKAKWYIDHALKKLRTVKMQQEVKIKKEYYGG